MKSLFTSLAIVFVHITIQAQSLGTLLYEQGTTAQLKLVDLEFISNDQSSKMLLSDFDTIYSKRTVLIKEIGDFIVSSKNIHPKDEYIFIDGVYDTTIYQNFRANFICKLEPNKYLLGGAIDSIVEIITSGPILNSLNYIPAIIQVDSNLNVIQSAKFSNIENGEFTSFAVDTASNSLFLSGPVSPIGFGNFDNLLIKLDSNLNISWAQRFGGTLDDAPLKMLVSSHGTLLLAGRTESYSVSNSESILSELDLNGNHLWSKLYATSGIDYFKDALEYDGYYYVLGNQGSVGPYLWITKVDHSGNVVWTNNYGASGSIIETPKTISVKNNHLFVLSNRYEAGQYDTEVFKLDTTGILNKEKLYGDFNFMVKNDFTSKLKFIGNNICLLGQSNTFTTNYSGYMVMDGLNLSDTCNAKEIGQLSNPASLSVSAVSPTFQTMSLLKSGLPITSYTQTTAKTEVCNISTGITETTNKGHYTLFPNPTDGKLTIVSDAEILEIKIYNCLGTKEAVFQQNHISSQEYTFDFNSAPGTYIVTITTSHETMYYKLIHL